VTTSVRRGIYTSSAAQFPLWVNLRRAHKEHMFSDLPSNSDIAGRSRHVSNVPKPEISPNAKPLDARAVRFPSRAEDTVCRLAAPWRPRERTWRITASPADRPMSLGSRRARSHVPTTREARRWSIVNLSILVSNKCRALMNVCAMVRSVSL
jgi:hypothetical protein